MARGPAAGPQAADKEGIGKMAIPQLGGVEDDDSRHQANAGILSMSPGSSAPLHQHQHTPSTFSSGASISSSGHVPPSIAQTLSTSSTSSASTMSPPVMQQGVPKLSSVSSPSPTSPSIPKSKRTSLWMTIIQWNITLSRLFKQHGIFCASHPHILLPFSAFLIITLSFPPLSQIYTYLTDDSYEPIQFWESPSSRAPLQEELFIERFGTEPFLRLEQVVINASDTEAMYRSGGGPGVIEKDLLVYALKLQQRLAEVEVPDPTFDNTADSESSEQQQRTVKLSDICYKPFADNRCLIHSPLEFWHSSLDKLSVDMNIYKTLSNPSVLSSFGTPMPLHSVFGGVVMADSKRRKSKNIPAAGAGSKPPGKVDGSSILGADSIVITYFIEETRRNRGAREHKEGWTGEVWDRIWDATVNQPVLESQSGKPPSSEGLTPDAAPVDPPPEVGKASPPADKLNMYNIAWRSKGEVKHLYYVFQPTGSPPNAGSPTNSSNLISAEFMILAVSYAIVFLYISLVLGKVELVKSKFGLGFSAVIMVFSSLLMSVGLCSMMGVVTTLVPCVSRLWTCREVLPFLIIAVGVENIFVLTNAVVTTSLDLPVKERVGLGLSKVGSKMTASLAGELFFLLTVSMFNIPALQEFCLFASVAVVMDFFMQITFFTTILSIDIRRLEMITIILLICLGLSTTSSDPASMLFASSAPSTPTNETLWEDSMSATADVVWDIINPSRADRYVEIGPPVYITVIKPGDAPNFPHSSSTQEQDAASSKNHRGADSDPTSTVGVWKLTIEGFSMELNPGIFTLLIVVGLLGASLGCIVVTSIMYLYSKKSRLAEKAKLRIQLKGHGPIGSWKTTGGYEGAGRRHGSSSRHRWLGETFKVFSLSSRSEAGLDVEMLEAGNGAKVAWVEGSGEKVKVWDGARGTVVRMKCVGSQGWVKGGRDRLGLVLTLKGLGAVLGATKSGSLRVWDADTGKEVACRMSLGCGAISGVVVPCLASLGGEAVVVCLGDGSVKFVRFLKNPVSAAPGECKLKNKALGLRMEETVWVDSRHIGNDSPKDVVICPVPNLVICGCRDGRVEIYRIQSSPSDKTASLLATSRSVLYGHSGAVTALSYDPVLDVLFSGSDTGDVIIWHLPTGKEVFFIGGTGARKETRRSSMRPSFEMDHPNNGSFGLGDVGYGIPPSAPSTTLRSRRPSSTNLGAVGGMMYGLESESSSLLGQARTRSNSTNSSCAQAGPKTIRSAPLVTGHCGAITFLGVYHSDEASTPSTPSSISPGHRAPAATHAGSFKTHKLFLASSGMDECTRVWELRIITSPSGTLNPPNLQSLRMVKSISQPGCTIAALHGSLLVGARRGGLVGKDTTTQQANNSTSDVWEAPTTQLRRRGSSFRRLSLGSWSMSGASTPRTSEDSNVGTYPHSPQAEQTYSNRISDFGDGLHQQQHQQQQTHEGSWEVWMADLSDSLEFGEIRAVPIGEDGLKGTGVFLSAVSNGSFGSARPGGALSINSINLQSVYPLSFQARKLKEGFGASNSGRTAENSLAGPPSGYAYSRAQQHSRKDSRNSIDEEVVSEDMLPFEETEHIGDKFDSKWDDEGDDDDDYDEEEENSTWVDDDMGQLSSSENVKPFQEHRSGARRFEVGDVDEDVDDENCGRFAYVKHNDHQLSSYDEDEDDEDDDDESSEDYLHDDDYTAALPVLQIQLLKVCPWGVCIGFGNQVRIVTFESQCFGSEDGAPAKGHQEPTTTIAATSPSGYFDSHESGLGWPPSASSEGNLWPPTAATYPRAPPLSPVSSTPPLRPSALGSSTSLHRLSVPANNLMSVGNPSSPGSVSPTQQGGYFTRKDL
ncbi:hypothetical protein HDV05_004079 [Chytridiales sp. JEL 0842]|nr:hypothetical protein HDV05_004079 [Chytridiales sp. JEL 0842]